MRVSVSPFDVMIDPVEPHADMLNISASYRYALVRSILLPPSPSDDLVRIQPGVGDLLQHNSCEDVQLLPCTRTRKLSTEESPYLSAWGHCVRHILIRRLIQQRRTPFSTRSAVNKPALAWSMYLCNFYPHPSKERMVQSLTKRCLTLQSIRARCL